MGELHKLGKLHQEVAVDDLWVLGRNFLTRLGDDIEAALWTVEKARTVEVVAGPVGPVVPAALCAAGEQFILFFLRQAEMLGEGGVDL